MSSTSEVVDHFFRHESGRIIATLTKRFGTNQLEIVEDAVQEAMLKAMQIWPFKGVPGNPSAWILTVAQNRILDLFKHEKTKHKHATHVKEDLVESSKKEVDDPRLDQELSDDLLKMIFACCHPKLSTENQVILTLKILCGFGMAEVARGLLKSEDAVAKSYQRARKKFKEEIGELEVPIGPDLNNRLDTVATIIYMVFNEGYHSIDPKNLIKKEVCAEAMRLCFLIIQNKLLVNPKLNALMALMCFHSSRFDARLDDIGNLVTLENQDRELWSKVLIEQGRYYLEKAAFGRLSAYHLQAGIAAAHSLAPSYEETNWEHILVLYDSLVNLNPGSTALLHRIVPFSKVNGPKAGLLELEKLSANKQLSDNHLFHAIKGTLLEELKSTKEAIESFTKAMSKTNNQTEKIFLKEKIDRLSK